MQVEDFCNRIHKGIIKQFKYALVWGTSVKHRPQKVGKEHVLHDEDIIQVRTGHLACMCMQSMMPTKVLFAGCVLSVKAMCACCV